MPYTANAGHVLDGRAFGAAGDLREPRGPGTLEFSS